MKTRAKVSHFADAVYKQLAKIPRGKVVSYGELARSINCRSAQAVGQALRANPYAPEVPCHRVVRIDGSLGGYSGKTEGEIFNRKITLLKEEGVQFLPDGRVDLAKSGYFFPI